MALIACSAAVRRALIHNKQNWRSPLTAAERTNGPPAVEEVATLTLTGIIILGNCFDAARISG